MDLWPVSVALGGLLGSGLTLAAYPASVRHELTVVRGQLADGIVKFEAQGRIVADQADLIRQFRGDAEQDPAIRKCFCPRDRWDRWRDGLVAGPDGIVGDSDDDLSPDPPP